MNRKGMASIVDALVFLLLMMIATAALYGLSTTNADTQEAGLDTSMSRWTAMAFVRCELNNTTAGEMIERGAIDVQRYSDILNTCVPVGYVWELEININGEHAIIGNAPGNNVGAWLVTLGDNSIIVRTSRS